MNTQVAAQIIETMISSIRENPNQFQFTVHVTSIGASGNASSGGIGMIGNAQGGGIGINASASAGEMQIKIVQERAESAINQQIQDLVNQLSDIAKELKSDSPDKSKLEKMYEAVKSTWGPGVISSVIGNLLSVSFMG